MAEAAPVATALPPAVARNPLVIRFDLEEAACNIDALADELHDDGSNRRYIIRMMRAEIGWLHDLLEELEKAR